jgi:hypothetical protein
MYPQREHDLAGRVKIILPAAVVEAKVCATWGEK